MLLILNSFYITILQKTFFSQKKSPCGKMHTRQNIVWFFSKKKAPAGKCTHGKIFFDVFLKKRPLREDAHTAKYFFNIVKLLCHAFNDDNPQLESHDKSPEWGTNEHNELPR